MAMRCATPVLRKVSQSARLATDKQVLLSDKWSYSGPFSTMGSTLAAQVAPEFLTKGSTVPSGHGPSSCDVLRAANRKSSQAPQALLPQPSPTLANQKLQAFLTNGLTASCTA